jgi:hypothetical protein
MECSALCRECHSLLNCLFVCVLSVHLCQKPKEVGSSSSSFTYYENQLFDNLGLLPPTEGRLNRLHIKCGILGVISLLLLLLLLLFWLHLSANVCVTPGDLPAASNPHWYTYT